VKAWGVIQRKRPDNAPEIEAFVDARFHYSFDNDKDIVRKLQRDNYDVTEYYVRALRWKNGWLRRAPDKSALRLQQADCLQRVKQALEEGSVRQYGAGMLTSFFRGQGVHLNLYVPISLPKTST
jgi:DNA-binding Lrp family transcriptional regulator